MRIFEPLNKRWYSAYTVNIRIYALQLYVTCYITGRIAIDNFHGNHRQISRSSSGMQPRQGELEIVTDFVTAGHPAPTLGEPVPPSQRGTRGFASGAIGSSQSETVTGSREGNMSY